MALPHAYVVEYRVVDQCSPPDCRIDGRRTFGRASGGQEEAGSGAYVAVGTDKDELFAKRGMVIAPFKELTFTLPARAEASVLDMSLTAVDVSGGAFRAMVEVTARGVTLAKQGWEGASAPFEAHTDLSRLGREEQYFLHVRQALPSRADPITVTLRNEGKTPLGVGAPLVLQKVEGRGPRQAFLVFFDAVPYPIFEELYRSRAHPITRWISGWVEQGTLFSQAISPGQLTGSFVRRFFRGDYYRLEGDLSLAGRGFDDTPPARALGPVARMAEQGFVTSAMASNLYLSPVLSGIGFDSDYNIESTKELQIHPQVLAERFAREMEVHGEDDALFVIWYANTHFPWLEGRGDAPPFGTTAFGDEELDQGVLQPIWRNLFDSVDSLRRIVERAKAQNAAAERIWILGADHGHTFTLASRARPWRLTEEAVEKEHMHCCLSTEQEARTPLVLIVENGARSVGRQGTIDRPISTLAAWREIERRFGVALDLPATSAFDLPWNDPGFDDGILVSVGNSGSLFGRYGNFSYHAFQPAMNLLPAWEAKPKVALLLRGSSEPAGDIPGEELYQPSVDPGEKDNLAHARFGDLIDMRTRMANWLAEYGDGPERERYEYALVFEHSTETTVTAPRAFTLEIDESRTIDVLGKATVKGTVLRFRDGERPLGVVDFAGGGADESLLVRCGASGLPLAHLDAGHRRLNLALARTNCVGVPSAEARPMRGEAVFRAKLVQRRQGAGASAAAELPELKNALQRWGYVREK